MVQVSVEMLQFLGMEILELSQASRKPAAGRPARVSDSDLVDLDFNFNSNFDFAQLSQASRNALQLPRIWRLCTTWMSFFGWTHHRLIHCLSDTSMRLGTFHRAHDTADWRGHSKRQPILAPGRTSRSVTNIDRVNMILPKEMSCLLFCGRISGARMSSSIKSYHTEPAQSQRSNF